MENKRYWTYNPNGQFSVKSAYLLGIGYYEKPMHSSTEDCKRWGHLVWNMTISPKVKVFMWRALSDIIPTTVNLKNHYVPTDGMCEMCCDRWGTTEHMLAFCPRIRGVWKGMIFWELLKEARGHNLMEIASHMRRVLDDGDYDIWCIMTWRVFGFICSLRHNKVEACEMPKEVDCRAFLETYIAAKPTLTMDRWLGVKLGQKK